MKNTYRIHALSVLLFSRIFILNAFVAPVAQPKSPYQTIISTSGIPYGDRLFMSSFPDPKRMREIMEEEAKNPQNMKAAVNMLKNLKPGDIDAMLREMDKMPMEQKKQLEAMGMNPEIMRQSMEMMKSMTPEELAQKSELIESMSPDELLEKSRQVQANFSSVASSSTRPSSNVVDAKIVDPSDDEDGDDDESEPIPPPSSDVLDTLYKAAEMMSSPPDGKVTLVGFSSIPPISLLIGDDPENDVSKKELAECWADASRGASRVDRAGFERMWVEVQEYFYQPIMDKARERTMEKAKKRGSPKPTVTVTTAQPKSSTSFPKVGQDISSEQLEKQVKNMSDSDMSAMLEQMKNMTPEQELRMKAMGVDPAMMKKTASLMSNNPLLKNAAKMMMKNMSAEDMKRASQQAQEQMSKMSPEDIERAMSELEKRNIK